MTYFAHNLLSVGLVSDTAGFRLHREASEQTLDLCTGQLLAIDQEIDARRQQAFKQEANRRLQQQIDAYEQRHVEALRAPVFIFRLAGISTPD